MTNHDRLTSISPETVNRRRTANRFILVISSVKSEKLKFQTNCNIQIIAMDLSTTKKHSYENNILAGIKKICRFSC